jgi:C1A family cysteine protease
VPKLKTEKLRGKSVPLETEVLAARRLKELPPYINWYEREAVTRPMDQAGCGGCWAFSSISTVETMDYLYGPDKKL